MQTAIKPVSYQQIMSSQNYPRLIAEYTEECWTPEVGPINPQVAIYQALEVAGVMQCFGAFCDDSIIGFASVLTSVLPHYGRKVASMESLFVTYSYRRTGLGGTLMAAVEGFARRCECAGIMYSAPAGSQLELLLEAKKRYGRCSAIFYRGLE